MLRLVVLTVLSLAATTAQSSTPHISSSQPTAADASCCQDRVGDANGRDGDVPTIGDIAVMIDMLFISGNEVACLAEADVNLSGGCNPTRMDITIGDIALWIVNAFTSKSGSNASWLGFADCLVCPPDGEPAD